MVKQYNTLWLSDIHLGCKNSKVVELLDFLDNVSCKKLYLVGDIIDLVKLEKKWYWADEYNRLFRKIRKLEENNTKVILLLGNHDYNIKNHKLLKEFGSVIIKEHDSYTTLSGKKLLIIHGEKFDKLSETKSKILLPLSRGMCRYKGNLFANIIEKNYVKLVYNRFIDHCISYTKKQGYDGIITGHMHNPKIIEKDGIVFYNTGDWLYSCSAIAETLNGDIQIIKYK